jgi:tetratricopeptide (TPR) repeat protein
LLHFNFDFSVKKVARRALSLCSLALIGGLVWSSASAQGWRAAIEEGDKRLKTQQLDLAEGCFRQALRQVKRDKSSTPDDQAFCMQKLAALLQDLDISNEAVPLYKKAIKVLERAHGKQSLTLVADLRALADILENDGEFKKAVKLDTRALDLASHGEPLVLAESRHALGRATFKTGLYVPAELCYQAALDTVISQKTLPSSTLLEEIISDYTDLLEKSYGPGKNLPSDVRVELLKDRVGQLPRKKGVPASSFEKEVSVRLANEALDKIPQAERGAGQSAGAAAATAVDAAGFGANTNSSLSLPAIPSAADASDPAAVEPVSKQKVEFYERMIAIDIKTLGPEHPSVARDLSGLAAVYMAAGRSDRAKELFMRALKIYENVYGGEAALVKRTRAMLELICESETSEENGSPRGNNFVSGLPVIPLAAQKIDIAIRLNYLAALCYSLGKVAEAEKVYSWALADTYYATGDQSMLLAAGLKDYARVLRSAGNAAKADALEGDAKVIARRAVAKQALSAFQ